MAEIRLRDIYGFFVGYMVDSMVAKFGKIFDEFFGFWSVVRTMYFL
jgi:hypothetical protein